jgi:hypothetical protein
MFFKELDDLVRYDSSTGYQFDNLKLTVLMFDCQFRILQGTKGKLFKANKDMFNGQKKFY